MIRKQDILDRAGEWGLRPDVVEKDYVLGWLLAGVALSPLQPLWIFKGGTSIKKCYFETYRFSEDLDFSLLADSPYAQAEIVDALRNLTRSIQQLSGIDFPEEHIEAKPRRNLQGKDTFECRVGYRGPLAFPGYPRIVFDLTRHEPVLDGPAARTIFHPYPDALPEGAQVLAYSFDELLAEKTRALYERARPRDLYDVVYLLDNRPEAFDFGHVRQLFAEKCQTKSVTPPTAADLIRKVSGDAELRSEWANMLAHQLPSLPDLNTFLLRLPELLRWIDRPEAVPPGLTRPAVPVPANTIPVAAEGIRFWGRGVPLETLRFAGANRQLIAFEYDGRRRVAEPYSLRQAATGNILLYAWEEEATHIKAFNVDKIRNLTVTDRSFEPRYRIEFSSVAPARILPTAQHASRTPLTPGFDRQRPPGPQMVSYGPRYIFVCPYCQKQFAHKSNNPALRKHKAVDGYWDCPGRQGYLIEVR